MGILDATAGVVNGLGPGIKCPKCKWSLIPAIHPLPEATYQGTCSKCHTVFNFRPANALPVQLTINGNSFEVKDVHQALSLSSFLREVALLPATKVMCQEGGCGACVVAATIVDGETNRQKTIAVNACLQPVIACNGWRVVTAEGIGNRREGFHLIQQQLVDKNGTQCGYCTPGMVMSMYSLVANTKTPLKSQTIEDAFDGNICRCTGYRPIIDALKSFTGDASDGVTVDIEDLNTRLQYCKDKAGSCTKKCRASCNSTSDTTETPAIPVALRNAIWQTPHTLEELLHTLACTSGMKVRLVAGNTGTGVFKEDGPYDIFINVRHVREFNEYSITDEKLSIGASVSMSDVIAVMEDAISKEQYRHLQSAIKHFRRSGNTPVRNLAGLAGNVIMKWSHRDFPSDVFIVLETLQASLCIVDCHGKEELLLPSQFLGTDMNHKVIVRIDIPGADGNVTVKTYKVMQRAQNCKAYVNAGFRMSLDPEQHYQVMSKPTIVFGGLSAQFNHAQETETYLTGKSLLRNEIVQEALSILESEIIVDDGPALISADVRKTMAVSLLYKFILHVCGPALPVRLRSGGDDMVRPLSYGKQDYETDENTWPVGQPMTKIGAELQASGEAEYAENVPFAPDQLYAQFVLTSQANATIAAIDASDALAVPGVVRFLTHKDIPSGGENNAMPNISFVFPEEVLCSGRALYNGQALGIVVAESPEAADMGVKRVKVTYTDAEPSILTTRDGVEKESFFPKFGDDIDHGDVEAAFCNSYRVITGTIETQAQYQMHLENQSAVCLPRDDGVDIHASTQWPDGVQAAVANILGIKCSDVHVEVKRLGGSFGAKTSRTNLVAAACALACKSLNRPIRLKMSLSDNMTMMGGREPFYITYKVGTTEEGRLTAIEADFYINVGCSQNESMEPLLAPAADNACNVPNWKIRFRSVKTNLPSMTYARCPGVAQMSFFRQTILEHVAHQLGKDPLVVTKLNMFGPNDTTPVFKGPLGGFDMHAMVTHLEDTADVGHRQETIHKFNKENRWRKKGLGIAATAFPISLNFSKFNVYVTVYHQDGTVAVTHGGVELGQGINTRVTQTCAAQLGIPVSKVTIRPTDTLSNSNSSFTGGSMTGELCCLGVIDCCKQIKERLDNAKLPEGASWEQRILEFHNQAGDLAARAWVDTKDPHIVSYYANGAACTEIEVDILTGEIMVNRADILYDAGKSNNPTLDIGQIEGAFVFGLGYHLTEEMKYDPKTGATLTNSTWNYKVPMPKDIPVDFRIELLRDNPNNVCPLGSKAAGEPPMLTSSSVITALRQALQSARKEAGEHGFCTMDLPMTVDRIFAKCLNTRDLYTVE